MKDNCNNVFGICAHYGFSSLLKIYQEMGCQSRDSRPLHLAVANNHSEITKTLIDTEASLVNAVDFEGRTALHVASFYGHIDIVRMLLNRGANVDAVTSTSRSTPLHLATLSGHTEVVGTLLNAGADPKLTMNLRWETPFHPALRNDNVERVLCFLHADQYLPESAISTECLSGPDQDANPFVAVLCGIEGFGRETSDGWTALHLAAAFQHAMIAEHLISHGANVGVKTTNGTTPLELAQKYDHSSVKVFLAPGKL